MHILVLGAAGMVGRKLTERLLRDGRLGKRDITRMTLQDVVAPASPAKAGFPVDTVTCDFAVARRRRKAGRRSSRRDFPSGGDRLRRGRARLRQGLSHQSRRHADAVRCHQARRRRLQAEGRVHLVDCGVRRAVSRRHRRRVLSYAAIELRHPEGDRGTAARRLFAPRLHGRRRHQPADHLHSPRSAQQGGLRILLRHPARTARGQGGYLAGIRGGPALACLAALGGRFPDPCGDHGYAQRWARAATSPCPACRPRSARRSPP